MLRNVKCYLILVIAALNVFPAASIGNDLKHPAIANNVIAKANADTLQLLDVHNGNVIWSSSPAKEWSEGYPVGNGRLGGMVLGSPQNERIALNHDLLWRQFWTYQPRNTAEDIKQIRAYNLSGQWDKGDELALRKIPFTGNAIYINPYVPAGDLYINMKPNASSYENYSRVLDMERGIVEINYQTNNISYKRETYASWKYGVLVTHLTTDRAGTLSGAVSLSRLLDPECTVTGYATPEWVVMKGAFEEGRAFAVVAKIVQRGGRLTTGKKELRHAPEDMPKKDYGLRYVFSANEMFGKGDGASACFDSSDEVMILLAIAIDDEGQKGEDLIGKCMERIAKAEKNGKTIKADHVDDFKKIYNRVSLQLSENNNTLPTDLLVRKSASENKLPAQLLEQMFNMSRYLAISSGRPQPQGQLAKAPINLQGIWNQDRRPAWDCDYHLDLNLEMSYWPLSMLNLGDLMVPLMDWAERLKAGGRVVARDMYGSNGIAFGVVADYKNIGNVDNFAFFWTGGAAWIAQVLWQHWKYTNDETFLKNRLYPFLVEIGAFYEDFLVKDHHGQLVPALSASPEMAIAGRERMSFSSSASTMDLELIIDIFNNLIEAGTILKENPAKIKGWRNILTKVPLPRINADGSLSEWLEEHPMLDSGHRHRSPLIGLVPGERISYEHTRAYADAAYKTLLQRNEHGRKSTQSFTFVWDAQMLARLNKGQEAYDELKRMIPVHVLENLLITCNDWSGARGGLAWFKDVKLFQIEANIAAGAAIIEMFFQDRQGVLKFIPALPAELPDGKVAGLRARGGFEVGLEWKEGKMMSATIESRDGKECRFRDDGFEKLKILNNNMEVMFQRENGVIVFKTGKGKKYALNFL
ncbi:glycosyl hydrolase family 95 catalytic domain-containing protein [Agriterribacter sp.]|uniref:glycosyl hydrolase family 95 catalytic domain-containing protein n=1 Tax=Agriterribacter sp. TaxID=2821509 RepID=UPI002CF570D8|nr:glycoside hydrolase N-terminal domain-containing protein [Agriterribacter sp.]HTN08228.1 glycoside hydrolase N-terminal domain-containing protein [Agriterribacter sp.]